MTDAPSTPLPAHNIPAQVTRERLLFIDGLRCIAVLWVVLTHFIHNSPFNSFFSASLNPLLYRACWKGYLGVEIFFVISGFVIALSLARDHLTPRFALGFAVRRYVRLFPPYITVVFLWIATTALGKLLFPSYDLPQPSAAQLAAHFLYLQNLLGLGDIVGPTWTLCLEFQFYLFYALCALLVLSDNRPARIAGAILFATATLVSIALTVFSIPVDGLLLPKRLFVYNWYLFALGVLATFSYLLPRTRRWMLFPLLAGVLMWFHCRNEALLVGICTFAAILLASALGRMGTWLSNPIVQYFGSRSYSIYLVNWGVGLRFIDMIHRFAPQNLWSAWLCTIAGFAVTLAVSELLYRLLERPALKLSQALKHFFQPA